MARDPQSLHLPLRTSNANVDNFDDNQEDLRSEKANNRTSKAQKILGTAEAPIQQNSSPRDDASSQKRRTRRPSFMKGPSFVPFPTINADDGMTQQNQPQLRVRASSPLLVNTQDAAAASNPKKTVHQSGSASTLFSYFNSRDSTTTTTTIESPTDGKPAPSSISLGSKNSTKDSKRKLRPPRIDLSLLFPKPKPEKPAGAPMLSPQRMVHSPAPLSALGEFPKSNNSDTKTSGRRYTETQSQMDLPTTAGPPPPAIPRPGSHRSTPANRSSAISTDTRNTEFLEPSLQRTVRTNEMDMALQNYSEQQAASERAQSDAASSLYSRGRDQMHSSKAKSDRGARRVSSNGSTGGWSKETYLSPKSQPRPARRRQSPPRDQWPAPPSLRETDTSSMSKKSSKSTLANSDLNISSVLCLSSSEDEDDHDEEPPNDRTGVSHLMRDSVTTYGEFEPEICTASAAQATKGPAVRRLDLRQAAAVKHRGPTMLMSPSIHRNDSTSTARSSYIGRRAPGGIPTISEPDISDHFPAPGGNGRASAAPLENKQGNRRSRVIAVTRQEQSLLEAMRQRRGKVTPSLLNEARFSQNTITTHRSNPNFTHHNHNDNNSHANDTDKESMLSAAPERDSLYSTDMSFLRLSASIPSYTTATTATNDTHNNQSRSDQGAAHLDKDSHPFQGAASDAEQKTLNSPRASLVYSESLPSPATSGASPLTPTLPIHRFSPLPSQHQHSPPTRRHLPTSAPNDQRRHSRRRTDSSEAIVLGEATEESAKDNDEFPIWALGWNHDLAAVH